jgi:hypothetical protein|tara:strand:- start:1534 stop:1761 length:228 start_codon:yes stop_codon:yes gene_type:complete
MNLGTGDRIIRLIGGFGFVMLDYFSNAQWEMILLFIGLWSVLTSAFGYCPFYRLTGISTCPTSIQDAPKVSGTNE